MLVATLLAIICTISWLVSWLIYYPLFRRLVKKKEPNYFFRSGKHYFITSFDLPFIAFELIRDYPRLNNKQVSFHATILKYTFAYSILYDTLYLIILGVWYFLHKTHT